MPPRSKRRKTTSSSAPQEITFDPAAREEYLSGFHKRKQARIKLAKEEAEKRDKEERLRLRRELRRQRKEDLERHVSEVNALLRKSNGEISEGGEGTENTGDEDGGEEEFKGFDEVRVEEIDREEEYVDEDKYTTVTIESVSISKEGFERPGDGNEDEGGVEGKEEDSERTKKREWTKERPKSDQPKKKKKKFRYETKAERKVTRMKQGAKNRAQAMARKGK